MSVLRNLFVTGLVLPGICLASNVVNGNFDKDLSGWTIEGDATWTGTENVPINSVGGALSLSTSGTASADQCVAVGALPPNGDGLMLLEVEMRFDLLDQQDSCDTDGVVTISVEGRQGTGCSDSNSVMRDSYGPEFAGYETDGSFWESETFLLSTDRVDHVHINLSAACATHRGTVVAYFDNVLLRCDRIFTDDLER